MLALLIIQIIIVVALVIIVLMQNPSVDGLAGLNNNVDTNHTMTSSGKAGSFLTKLTYIIAALFIINNLCIMNLQSKKYSRNKQIIESIVQAGDVPIND